MPTTCEIDFENNPAKVIYSGLFLRGTINLNLTQPKDVRGVYIRIKGEAFSRWTQGSGDKRKTYSGAEDYLNEKTYLVGDENGTHGNIRLELGSYSYAFQSYLPPQLPTSFEGKFGHIRYKICVVLDIPMWPDKEFEVPFTVIKAINLNENPTLREPMIVQEENRFLPCCLLCCCESEPLDIIIRIPVGGYVPGQTFNVELIADNQSSQEVDAFSVQLIKESTYFIFANSGRRKVETNIITETTTDGCLINQKKKYNPNLQVPPIPPTDDTTSNIVKVRYYCRVVANVALCHPDPVLQLPIIIGTYPILDPETTTSNDVIQKQPTASKISPSAPPLPNESTEPLLPSSSAPVMPHPSAPIQFPNDEPPTYEETMEHGGESGTQFIPKYPMFRRQTSYSNNG